MNNIRKAILFGLGAASMTKDKIQEFINQMVKENNITVEEGREIFNETIKKANKYSYERGIELQKTIAKAVKDLGLATKKDLKDLENKVSKKPPTKAKAKSKAKPKKSKKAKK
jgi:polyhydroxyalkanoate synthesis regulator phasin